MKKILVVDNHDSFVYNLVEYLRLLGDFEIEVIYNEEIREISGNTYSGILLSPGAGLPIDYPEMLQLIRAYYKDTPILGICLGHQALANYFGATLKRFNHPKHGHASELHILDTEEILFRNVAQNSRIGRYHSWVIDSHNIPDILKVTAVDEEGNIMAIRHKKYALRGVQFHPESIISTDGKKMISNWLNSLI